MQHVNKWWIQVHGIQVFIILSPFFVGLKYPKINGGNA